jgi:flavodoxin
MKVERVLTYKKKAIFFHSLTGNTKAIVKLSNTSKYDVFDLTALNKEEIKFNDYDLIFLGLSTYGIGIPHEYFKTIYDELNEINNKKILLFGSGNTLHKYYCGGLDVLKNLLEQKNEIIEIFRFESYPNETTLINFQSLLDKYSK